MRSIIGAVTALSLLCATSCTAIRKEVRHPGGYPGYVLDKRSFDASGSKQMILLRAALILALAAEMGRVTVDADEADAFARHLSSAAAEINHAAADIYPVGGREPCSTADPEIGTAADCSGFYENFEANLPLIESRLVRAMLAALPGDQARRFLEDVGDGNILSAALRAFRTVTKAAGGLHAGAARYRTGLEIVAGAAGANCYTPEPFTPGNFGTVIEAASCIGLSQNSLFARNPPDQRQRLAVAVQPAAFVMLMRAIASACVALPYGGSVSEVAASRELRRTACGAIRFDPAPRPSSIGERDEAAVTRPGD